MFAIPPLLELRAQPLREQGDHRAGGTGSRLEQFHHVGGATPRCQIRHEATAHPAPARFLAAPSQAAAGPGQFLPVKQAAAGAKHPEAVLAARAGVDAAGLQQPRCRPSRQACDLGGLNAGRRRRGLAGGVVRGGSGSGGRGRQGIERWLQYDGKPLFNQGATAGVAGPHETIRPGHGLLAQVRIASSGPPSPPSSHQKATPRGGWH